MSLNNLRLKVANKVNELFYDELITNRSKSALDNAIQKYKSEKLTYLYKSLNQVIKQNIPITRKAVDGMIKKIQSLKTLTNEPLDEKKEQRRQKQFQDLYELGKMRRQLINDKLKSEKQIRKFNKIINKVGKTQEVQVKITYLREKPASYQGANVIEEEGKQYTERSTAQLVIVPSSTILNIKKDTFLTIDDPRFDVIMTNIGRGGNYEIKKRFDDIASALDAIKLTNIKEVAPNTLSVPINEISIRKDTTEQFINNRFISYMINYDSASLDKFVSLNYMNQFTIDKYRANACLFTIIIDTYKNAIEKNYKCPLEEKREDWFDYEFLWNLIYPERKFSKIGELPTTFKHSIKYFEKYNLGLRVVNYHNEIIFQYPDNIKTKQFNKNIFPNILNLVYHNTHVYKITDNKSFVENIVKLNNIETLQKQKSTMEDKISNRFIIPKTKSDCSDNIFFFKNPDQIVGIINKNKKLNYFKLYCNGDLREVLNYLVEYKWTPKISCHNGEVTQIRIENLVNSKNKQITIVMQYPFFTEGEDKVKINDREYYAEFEKQDDSIKNYLINKNNLSFYTEEAYKFLTEEYIPINYGRLQDKLPEIYGELDVRKAYLSNLIEMKGFPVLNHFEKPKLYDGHEIKDMNMYRCKTLQKDAIYNSNIILTTGIELKGSNIKVEILEYLEPSFVNENNIEEMINDLWKSKLYPEHKKFIPNKNIGLLGKKFNKREDCVMYKELVDANTAKNQYGGYIYEIDGVYYHIIKKKREIVCGFLPMHLFILSIMRMKMYLMKQKLENAGLKVLGYKTDAIYFELPSQILNNMRWDDKPDEWYDNYFIDLGFDLGDNIGQLTFNTNKIVSKNIIKFNENKYVSHVPDDIIINNIEIEDERNLDEIYSKIVNKTMIKSFIPGSGKTYSLLNYAKKNYAESTLVVCPTNWQCCSIIHNYNLPAITLHNLCGMGIDSEVKHAQYDLSDVKLVIFEEFFAHPVKHIYKVAELMKKHDGIMFLANGDPKQNQPVQEKTNKKKINRIINELFPNQIFFNINKRCKSEEDGEKLKKIHDEIFIKKKSPEVIINKFFEDQVIFEIDEIKDNKAITYYNQVATTVNSIIHSRLAQNKNGITLNGDIYYEGLIVRCLESYKLKKGVKLFRNYQYKIIKIGKKYIRLIDELSKEKFKVSIRKMKSAFTLPYSMTCHSCQGASIDEKFTIFDVKSNYVDMNWFWTALTRTTDLSKLTFFMGKLPYQIKDLKQLIKGYKRQDEKKNRKWQENEYVTATWIEKEFQKNKKCGHCKDEMTMEKNSQVGISVNRRDNNLPHIKSNCYLTCVHCNVSMK